MARKPKAEKPAAALPAPPPRNIGALTPDERLALHLQHCRKIRAAIDAKNRAVADMRNFRKVAKSDLGDEGLKEVDTALEMETPAGEAKMRDQFERIKRVAAWHGADIGTQLGLLDTLPTRDWFEDGKRQGLAGEAYVPHGGLSSADEGRRLQGYEAGQAVLRQGFFKTDVVDGNGSAAAAPGAPAEGEEDLRGAEQRQRASELAPGIGTEPSTARVKQ